ncbi:pyridoxamine 5'-phosphate oxidase family protein [Aquisphaera insulae]|uniref:pyridoxamine 5'-phosphate oxidase family protein n=1 Tax=Aquisphaera insulae TaxID=2712864 RepID=UPI0013EC6E7C|nr:pyridoxamine 5'-phosphate oxidase family protein [Aquisphaera insulae]
MGKIYDQIDASLAQFLENQHLFFVGTAPSSLDGHLNISPKGLDSFRILSPTRVAYLDLTGSGIETVAHLRENGRISLLFCAFEGRPRIVRLYGVGRAIERNDAEWSSLIDLFPAHPGARTIIVVDLKRIADACGYAIPRYAYEGERSQLIDWANRQGDSGLDAYRSENNAASIDGIPGLAPREEAAR